MTDRKCTDMEVPEFRPSIPSHLLDSASPGQKFLMERISVLIQHQKWHSEKIMEMRYYWCDLEEKVDDLEKFQIAEESKSEGKRRAYKWKKMFFILVAVVGYPVYLQIGEKLGLAALIKSLFGL
jgi:hypothetical protein